MVMSDLKAVLKEIKDHCDDTPCEKCQFYNLDGGGCLLDGVPSNWSVEEIFESLIEKDDWRQEE